ncbi:MAG TPA: peptidoglycan-binding protein [Baekduia sp.]|nr:peptidoglycan-binding protein [Baekduia sp.]
MSKVRTAAATLVVGVAAGGATWLLLPDEHSEAQAVNDTIPLGRATVERRDLVDRQDVDGTLGYATTLIASAPAAGTITRLRDEGTTVRRGWSLLSVDAQATGWVIYGKRPMYRDLGPGVDDGSDVRQLERNLKALGYDPGAVDKKWTWKTTAAVKDFQDDRDLDETGTLTPQEVVVSDGPARIGEHSAEVGDAVRPGAPVTKLTERTPVVTAAADAGLASTLRRGAPVSVTLPDGRVVRGRITKVGTVAKAGQDGGSPTVDLRVRLRAKRHGRLDGAPVTVTLATGSTKDALAVPITALVATGTAKYAVQLAGSRRLVAVTLGAFADGWVEVDGAGLAPGTRVVVPA